MSCDDDNKIEQATNHMLELKNRFTEFAEAIYEITTDEQREQHLFPSLFDHYIFNEPCNAGESIKNFWAYNSFKKITFNDIGRSVSFS